MDGGYMDSGLPPKKQNSKRAVITIVILFGTLLLWRNISASRNYPFHVASMWQCDDPHFSLIYTRTENGMLTSYEELEWGNETIPVDVCFLMREYDVFPAASSAYEDRLFGGTWKYRDGNFVLVIKEDFLFDNKYSELVFSPVMQIQ